MAPRSRSPLSNELPWWGDQQEAAPRAARSARPGGGGGERTASPAWTPRGEEEDQPAINKTPTYNGGAAKRSQHRHSSSVDFSDLLARLEEANVNPHSLSYATVRGRPRPPSAAASAWAADGASRYDSRDDSYSHRNPPLVVPPRKYGAGMTGAGAEATSPENKFSFVKTRSGPLESPVLFPPPTPTGASATPTGESPVSRFRQTHSRRSRPSSAFNSPGGSPGPLSHNPAFASERSGTPPGSSSRTSGSGSGSGRCPSAEELRPPPGSAARSPHSRSSSPQLPQDHLPQQAQRPQLQQPKDGETGASAKEWAATDFNASPPPSRACGEEGKGETSPAAPTATEELLLEGAARSDGSGSGSGSGTWKQRNRRSPVGLPEFGVWDSPKAAGAAAADNSDADYHTGFTEAFEKAAAEAMLNQAGSAGGGAGGDDEGDELPAGPLSLKEALLLASPTKRSTEGGSVFAKAALAASLSAAESEGATSGGQVAHSSQSDSMAACESLIAASAPSLLLSSSSSASSSDECYSSSSGALPGHVSPSGSISKPKEKKGRHVRRASGSFSTGGSKSSSRNARHGDKAAAAAAQVASQKEINDAIDCALQQELAKRPTGIDSSLSSSSAASSPSSAAASAVVAVSPAPRPGVGAAAARAAAAAAARASPAARACAGVGGRPVLGQLSPQNQKEGGALANIPAFGAWNDFPPPEEEEEEALSFSQRFQRARAAKTGVVVPEDGGSAAADFSGPFPSRAAMAADLLAGNHVGIGKFKQQPAVKAGMPSSGSHDQSICHVARPSSALMARVSATSRHLFCHVYISLHEADALFSQMWVSNRRWTGGPREWAAGKVAAGGAGAVNWRVLQIDMDRRDWWMDEWMASWTDGRQPHTETVQLDAYDTVQSS
eukprot:jgi/Mesen1/2930/ME000175S02085